MLRDKIKEIFAKPFSDIDKIVCLEALVQDEIDRLKAQHAEEIEKLMQETNHDKGMKELLHDELQITKCQFKGYRQAVKDILGGENND